MPEGKILLHVCCAPCAVRALEGLAAEPAAGLALYWYNPNIHPLLEYRRRLKAVHVLTERIPYTLYVADNYGLGEFVRLTADTQETPARCALCYQLRLRKAAEFAAQNGFAAFTSSLCTSRHQSHEMIRTSGEAAAREFGVPFMYRDWRDFAGEERLHKGLYRQQYCGCIFSEYERFKDTTTHLYRGADAEAGADLP